MADEPLDPTIGRALRIIRRAARSGYRLTRGNPTPYLWQLTDAEDNTPIHAAETLDEIERWLDG